jgi:hypothetical protein
MVRWGFTSYLELEYLQKNGYVKDRVSLNYTILYHIHFSRLFYGNMSSYLHKSQLFFPFSNKQIFLENSQNYETHLNILNRFTPALFDWPTPGINMAK